MIKIRIGLIDFDGKIPNLALMKLSAYHKSSGDQVELVIPGNRYEKVYCSVLFTWNRQKAEQLKLVYDNIEFGGTGWDLKVVLSEAIEGCKPDYTLYTPEFLMQRVKGIMTAENRKRKAIELSEMSIGFTSRGCVRNCSFCMVPIKEGCFRQVSKISDVLNAAPKVLTLLDNNFTADPLMIDKCQEVKERGLRLDLTQGIDIRLMTPEKAEALSSVSHMRSVHYAWDLMESEKKVFEGIRILSERIKAYNHLCFMLVGYNSTFEEDNYRLWRLHELGITPYVMIYNKNEQGDIRLKHFARWVNGFFYKVVPFEKYEPWVKAQNGQMTMF